MREVKGQKIKVVGTGMGLDDLGPRARWAIEGAEVLAGGKRLLAWFAHLPAEQLPLGGDVPGWLERVAGAAQGRCVTVLASGDPLFYGIGAALAQRLGPEALEFIPNQTAVQAAFARLGEPWHDARWASLHGRGWQELWPALAGGSARVAVFTDPGHPPDELAQRMLARSQHGWSLAVLENLGQADERVRDLSLEEAAQARFAPLNIVVLRRVAGLARPATPHLGMDEARYEHEAGLITKAEVRAVALAKLALMPGQTLWDVGAGCGSVGLEAGLLLPGGRVAAVEADPRRAAQIEANRARFGAAWLEVVQGRAPAALKGLPQPQRVFIGGGGDGLAGIIAASAHALAPDGVMVAAVVLLGGLHAARQAMAQAGLGVDVTQVAVSRGAPLAGDLRLEALNPVWLVRGHKEGKA